MGKGDRKKTATTVIIEEEKEKVESLAEKELLGEMQDFCNRSKGSRTHVRLKKSWEKTLKKATN